MQQRKPLKKNLQARKQSKPKADILPSERPIPYVDRQQLNKALFHASLIRNNAEIMRLIKAGAGIDATDKKGRTALMYAAHDGNIEICKFLLEKNANVTAGDNRGKTVLMYAANGGHTETCGFLLEHDANAMAKDNNDWTAFKYASFMDRTKTAKFLKSMELLEAAFGNKTAIAILKSFGKCVSS